MQIPLAAEAIAHIGNFPITNSMINAWIAIVLFLIVGLIVKSRKSLIPRGFNNFVETIVEFMVEISTRCRFGFNNCIEKGTVYEYNF